MKKTTLILCFAVLVLVACSNKTISTNTSDSTSTETITENVSLLSSENVSGTTVTTGGIPATNNKTNPQNNTLPDDTTTNYVPPYTFIDPFSTKSSDETRPNIIEEEFKWNGSDPPAVWNEVLAIERDAKFIVIYLTGNLMSRGIDITGSVSYDKPTRTIQNNFNDGSFFNIMKNKFTDLFAAANFNSMTCTKQAICFNYDTTKTPHEVIKLEYIISNKLPNVNPNIYYQEIAPYWILYAYAT